MIGAIDQLIEAALIWADADRGNYYCGCEYVAEHSHCPYHGDPCQRWPGKKVPDETSSP